MITDIKACEKDPEFLWECHWHLHRYCSIGFASGSEQPRFHPNLEGDANKPICFAS